MKNYIRWENYGISLSRISLHNFQYIIAADAFGYYSISCFQPFHICNACTASRIFNTLQISLQSIVFLSLALSYLTMVGVKLNKRLLKASNCIYWISHLRQWKFVAQSNEVKFCYGKELTFLQKPIKSSYAFYFQSEKHTSYIQIGNKQLLYLLKNYALRF